jgi:N-acetylglucosaminyldiphosphoundecaprenol N-acetyl-beta-D-mannosaminyltransferase
MYLRYVDPSWDSPETVEPPVAISSAHDERQRSATRPVERSAALAAVPAVELAGVRLHAINEADTVRVILDEVEAGRGGVVVTPNLDHLRRCLTDPHFEALVAEADLVVADGMPLVWASRAQGTPLPERVAGSNLISSLSESAARRGRSVFMLGGAPGTAAGAAKVLQNRFPGLKVAGTYCPPIGFEQNKRIMGELRDVLAASGADIVYVALGSPKQERLIALLRAALPSAWWLGVGNSFSFLCGHVRRAPRWMQRVGLEWLHRLCQEPRRLFRRYIIVGVPFGMRLMWRSSLNGVNNRLDRLQRRRPALARLIGQPSGANQAHFAPLSDADSGMSPGALSPAPQNGHPVARPGAAGFDGAGAADVPPAPGAAASLDDSGITMLSQVAGTDRMRAGGPDGPAVSRLPRLRALVLLGGSVRPSTLSIATGRSVLDLPLDANATLLNNWLSQAADLSRVAGTERIPVRILVNHASLEPLSADERFFGSFRVERDLSEYRGTGGVLRDVAADYADDDLILVANAAQILLDPLAAVAAALERKGGDVCLVSHEDGTPSGVMLVTCKALRPIAATGFVDMKEQVLPLIASRYDVRVMRRRRPTGLPVRTLEDYVQALRFHHRRRAGKPVSSDPLAEDFAPAFSLVEPGALVDPTARIHDSVVLAGGAVEAGAVLVRCLICPGAIVRRDRTAVDQFVTAAPTNGRPARTEWRTGDVARAAAAVAASGPAGG